MTDKEIIVDLIQYIKPQYGHIHIANTLWKDFDESKKIKLKETLIRNGLINLGDDNWSMKLTALGMSINNDSLDANGNIKLIRRITFDDIYKTIIATTAIITISWNIWKTETIQRENVNIEKSIDTLKKDLYNTNKKIEDKFVKRSSIKIK